MKYKIVAKKFLVFSITEMFLLVVLLFQICSVLPTKNIESLVDVSDEATDADDYMENDYAVEKPEDDGSARRRLVRTGPRLPHDSNMEIKKLNDDLKKLPKIEIEPEKNARNTTTTEAITTTTVQPTTPEQAAGIPLSDGSDADLLDSHIHNKSDEMGDFWKRIDGYVKQKEKNIDFRGSKSTKIEYRLKLAP